MLAEAVCSQDREVHEKVNQVRDLIEGHFPRLWTPVDLGLSTCATLLLKDNVNPVAVIYVGDASSGKSTVAEMFADAKVKGETFCYVSDDFTPAAFVSLAANVPTDKLDSVDLLLRIRHKVLVTPELATIFRGKEDDLTRIFCTLTRVLDGQGLMRDGGVHGRRGHRGDYVFAWLGCTTPFDKKVWKVMAQLGSRLFFLVLHQEQEVTLDDLINPTNVPYGTRRDECRQGVHEMIAQLFETYGGVRGVEWDSQVDDMEIKRWIARCAMLLAKMRSEPTQVKENSFGEDEYISGSAEMPYRAYAVLHNLARGHALVHGRRKLEWEDLPLIAKVTVSTMPPQFGQVFQALAGKKDHQLTRAEAQTALKVKSHTTALEFMTQLEQLGVMDFIQQGQGGASFLRWGEEWDWCGSEEFRAILADEVNLSKIGGCM